MNVRREQIIRVPHAAAWTQAARLAAAAGAFALLGACASVNPFASAPIDPASAVAGDVARIGEVRRPFPKFSDVPSMPSDVRPLAQWGQAAEELRQAGARLEAETAPETWSLEASEAFSSRAAAVLDANGQGTGLTGTEAFAQRLRERATPPPPPR